MAVEIGVDGAFNFETEDFEEAIREFGLQNTTAAVVDTVAEQNPGLFTYQSLRQGTAPIFEQLPGFQNRSQEDRRLTDEDILTIFTNVEKPGEIAAFTEALPRGVAKGLAGVGGYYAGAKALEGLLTLAGFVSPKTRVAAALGRGAQAIVGLGTAVFAANQTENALDAAFGKPDPIVPTRSAARTVGNLTGESISFSAIPILREAGQKVGLKPLKNLGTKTFLENYKNIARGAGLDASEIKLVDNLIKGLEEKTKVRETLLTPEGGVAATFLQKLLQNKNSPEYKRLQGLADAAGLSVKEFIDARKIGQEAAATAAQRMKVAERVKNVVASTIGEGAQGSFGRITPEAMIEKGIKGPLMTRVVRGIEQGAVDTLNYAKTNPARFYGFEGVLTGGMGLFTYGFESADPFDPLSEIKGSLVGPFAASAALQPAATLTKLTADLGTGAVNWVLGKTGLRSGELSKTEKEAALRLVTAFENSPVVRETMAGQFQGTPVDELSPEDYAKAREAVFNEFFDILESRAGQTVDEKGNIISVPPVVSFAEAGKTDLAKTVKKISETLGEGQEQLQQATSKGKQRMLTIAYETIEMLRASGNEEAFRQAALIQKALYEEEILGDLNKKTQPIIKALNQLILKGDAEDAVTPVFEESQRDEVSTRLFNLLKQSSKAAKEKETELWNKTQQYTLYDFYDAEGNPSDIPLSLKTIVDIEQDALQSGDEKLYDNFAAALNKQFGSNLKNRLMDHYFVKDATGQFTQPLQVKPIEELRATAADSPLNSKNAQQIRGRLLTQKKSLVEGAPGTETDKIQGKNINDVANALLQDLMGAGGTFANNTRVTLTPEQLARKIENPNDPDATRAYQEAMAYSKAKNDVFSRSFLGEKVFGTDKTRAARMEPEELIDEVFRGGAFRSAQAARIEQILKAGTFGVDEALGFKFLDEADVKLLDDVSHQNIDPQNLPAELMSLSIQDATERLVRQELLKLTREAPKTRVLTAQGVQADFKTEIDERKLNQFKNSSYGKRVMTHFPDLAVDLADVESANAALRAVREAPIPEETQRASAAVNFVLGAGKSPALAVKEALDVGMNSDPRQQMDALLKVIDDAFTTKDGLKKKTITVPIPDEAGNIIEETFSKEEALSGLRNAIFDLGITEAKGSSGGIGINGSALQEFFFREQPYGGGQKFKIMDWMEENNLLSKQKLAGTNKTFKQVLQKTLEEMANVENMFYTGDLDATLFRSPTAAQLFQVKMIGATLGARSQQQFNDLLGGIFGTDRGLGGGLVAAEAGSQLFQNLFFGIPETKTLQIMSELLTDSEKLAQFGREVINIKPKDSLFQRLRQFATRLPSETLRRRVPGVFTTLEDLDDRPTEIDEEVEVDVPVASPPLQGAETTPTMSPPPVAPAPVPTGPVDRSRYAALFPSDIASGLIRSQDQGIGSLMS